MSNRSTQERVYGIHTVFRYCRSLLDLASVKPLAYLLDDHGFHPSPAIGGQRVYAAPDINALIDARYVDDEASKQVAGGLLRSAGFPLAIDAFPAEHVGGSFHWAVSVGDYIQMTLYGWIDVTPTDRAEYENPYAEALLAITRRLYPLARPRYGFIANSQDDRHPIGQYRFVKKVQILTLSWVEFFGPEYVAHYGRDMLAGIPGWQVEDLPDGGLMYQSRQNCMVKDMVAHRRWQKQATAYLAAHGVAVRFDYPVD